MRININPLEAKALLERPLRRADLCKEQDTVKVPKFPILPNLSAWKLQVGKNLVAASGRIDLREISWWAEASKETSDFDTLEDSSEDRFASLDLKLSISLGVVLKKVNNEVTISIAQKEHAASMQGRMPKGRETAWLIFTFFKRNPKMGVMYGATDLAKLEWMGDQQIHKFLTMWRLMMTKSRPELSEILMQKMEKSVALKEDIAHYYRMDEGHRDKNYEFLIRTMEKYMDQERYRTNRANDLHSMLALANRGVRSGAPSITDPPGGNGLSEANDKKKRKKQERKAKAAAKAAAAPAPTPAGRGEGKTQRREKNACVTTSIIPGAARKPLKNAGLSIRSSLPPRSLR